ncbi:MAG: SEC-C domain-containing protein [Spirochaetales bacterium]|nr:SEC-C domain-containing protein [Spirochaetales bacterium]
MDCDSCCLGIFPKYKWVGVTQFIKDKVIPFFYWQSYRRLIGEEPWRGFAHGRDGILEAMMQSPNEITKGNNRNLPCPCGSGRKYKKCCLRRDEHLKWVLNKNYKHGE